MERVRFITVEDREALPPLGSCEECGGDLVPAMLPPYTIYAGSLVVRSSAELPGARCAGPCQSPWLPPQTTIHLLTAAIAVLQEEGELERAGDLEVAKTQLEATM